MVFLQGKEKDTENRQSYEISDLKLCKIDST